jgi:hypothetical protein
LRQSAPLRRTPSEAAYGWDPPIGVFPFLASCGCNRTRVQFAAPAPLTSRTPYNIEAKPPPLSSQPPATRAIHPCVSLHHCAVLPLKPLTGGTHPSGFPPSSRRAVATEPACNSRHQLHSPRGRRITSKPNPLRSPLNHQRPEPFTRALQFCRATSPRKGVPPQLGGVFSLAGNPRYRSMKPCEVTFIVPVVASGEICKRWPGISRQCAPLTSRPPLLVGEAPHCPIHGNNASGAFLVSLGLCWYLWVCLWGIRMPNGMFADVGRRGRCAPRD